MTRRLYAIWFDSDVRGYGGGVVQRRGLLQTQHPASDRRANGAWFTDSLMEAKRAAHKTGGVVIDARKFEELTKDEANREAILDRAIAVAEVCAP